MWQACHMLHVFKRSVDIGFLLPEFSCIRNLIHWSIIAVSTLSLCQCHQSRSLHITHLVEVPVFMRGATILRIIAQNKTTQSTMVLLKVSRICDYGYSHVVTANYHNCNINLLIHIHLKCAVHALMHQSIKDSSFVFFKRWWRSTILKKLQAKTSFTFWYFPLHSQITFCFPAIWKQKIDCIQPCYHPVRHWFIQCTLEQRLYQCIHALDTDKQLQAL